MNLYTVLKGILVLLSAVLCGLILQQGGRTDGINGMLNTSSNLNLFSKTKLRSTDKYITWIISGCLISYVAIIILLKHI